MIAFEEIDPFKKDFKGLLKKYKTKTTSKNQSQESLLTTI